MNVTSYITKGYENKSNWAICENEPNQSQNKPNTNPISEPKNAALLWKMSVKDYT